MKIKKENLIDYEYMYGFFSMFYTYIMEFCFIVFLSFGVYETYIFYKSSSYILMILSIFLNIHIYEKSIKINSLLDENNKNEYVYTKLDFYLRNFNTIDLLIIGLFIIFLYNIYIGMFISAVLIAICCLLCLLVVEDYTEYHNKYFVKYMYDYIDDKTDLFIKYAMEKLNVSDKCKKKVNIRIRRDV